MFNGYHYRNGRNLMNRLKAEAHRMPLFRGGYSEDYFSENALHILRLSHSAAGTHIDPFFFSVSARTQSPLMAYSAFHDARINPI